MMKQEGEAPAFKAAGVSDAEAQAAAEELADYENRVAKVEEG